MEISTVGASIWWAQETSSGSAPAMLDTFMTATSSVWDVLENVNTAPAVGSNPSTIDASNITDGITRYIPGRIDPGGILSLTLNVLSDDSSRSAWEDIVTDYEGDPTRRIWLAYVFPQLKNSGHYTVFRFPITPLSIKSSQGISQNSLATIEAPFVVDGVGEWYTTTAS